MADIFQGSTPNTTYKLNPYLKNRVKYHAASRLASQTGEGLVQALNVDGHTVTYENVWTAVPSGFPNNANKDDVNPVNATKDLVNVFKYGETATKAYNALPTTFWVYGYSSKT